MLWTVNIIDSKEMVELKIADCGCINRCSAPHVPPLARETDRERGRERGGDGTWLAS